MLAKMFFEAYQVKHIFQDYIRGICWQTLEKLYRFAVFL